MGQVTVTVSDKLYRIACKDGQEQHLVRLAAELDKKIGEMRIAFGEIGDSRLTVMAAITFMDEREDFRNRLAAMETELTSARAESVALDQALNRAEADIAAAVSGAAGRIEAVARKLSGTA
jgi:cell division protein ZapA